MLPLPNVAKLMQRMNVCPGVAFSDEEHDEEESTHAMHGLRTNYSAVLSRLL